VAGAVLLPQGQHPGCTTEGIDFNALLPKFKKAGAVVLGVSRDSVKSHDNFCAKQGFGFPLVSDGDEALCSAFDVIKMKNMYGKQVRGIERSTFLISPTAASCSPGARSRLPAMPMPFSPN
jgi:peroxiredoxin Q/BCP